MKEQILELRAQGKTYDEIKEILGCSKGTISYHCGEGQKEKTNNRTKEKRKNNFLLKKVDTFKSRKLYDATRNFQKRDNSVKKSINYNIQTTFNSLDVLEKFGENTICYLSGEPINLHSGNYQLDHIIPASRGGDNSLDNLGITHRTINRMKADLTPEELIEWCLKVVKYNGYEIIKNNNELSCTE